MPETETEQGGAHVGNVVMTAFLSLLLFVVSLTSETQNFASKARDLRPDRQV